MRERTTTHTTLCISSTQVELYLINLKQSYQCLDAVFKRKITLLGVTTGKVITSMWAA